MTTAATRMLVVALVVAAVAANAAAHRVADHARSRSDAATTHADSLEAQLAALRATVADLGERTTEVEDGIAQAADAATVAAASTAEAAGAAATIRSSLVSMARESSTAAGALDALHAAITADAGRAADLRTCLDGVHAASVVAASGDTGSVIARMQAVAEACRRAQAVSGSIDPTVVFPYDFADPYVLRVDGGYLAYATNSAGGAVQVLRSDDLGNWAFAGTALAGVAPWARPGATWAPSALRVGGSWVLYYAVRHQASGIQCISAATAAAPQGPFVDHSIAPLVCDTGEGGSIDPSPFVAADGSPYLLWKAEGETVGGGATLRAQRLTADGLAVTGAPAVLLAVDQAWEGRTVEGPSMALVGGRPLLVYSANRWDSTAYGVGAAWCDTPLGPCHKVPGPVLATDGPMVGPGGAELFTDGTGAVRLAFHAWQGDDVGYPEARFLHIGRLSVGGGTVAIAPV